MEPRRSAWRVRVPLLFAALVLLAGAYALRPRSPAPAGHAPAGLFDHLFGPVEGAFRAAERLAKPSPEQEALAELRASNAQLEARLALVESELLRWRLGERTRRGGRTVDYPPDYEFVAADVVGAGTSPRRHSVVINRGARHGVAPNMPVVNELGLVGIARRVGDDETTVQLASDPFFNVSARAENGRWRAIAAGQGGGGPLRVEPLRPLARLPENETLVTAGDADSLYPPGVPIGPIRAGGSDKRGLREIVCEPVALHGELEFVLVLTQWSRAGDTPRVGERMGGGANEEPQEEAVDALME